MKQFAKGICFQLWLILLAGPFISANPGSDRPSLLPHPQVVEWTPERFPCSHGDPFADPRIRRITVVSISDARLNMDESYRLVVRADSILIYATTEEGFFRAGSTLGQLLINDQTGKYFSGCRITDWPAFRVRGFMHDCGRSFIPLDELKREIEMLSGFKINTFHWHLTEDLAWRLASDIVPEVTGPVRPSGTIMGITTGRR